MAIHFSWMEFGGGSYQYIVIQVGLASVFQVNTTI